MSRHRLGNVGNLVDGHGLRPDGKASLPRPSMLVDLVMSLSVSIGFPGLIPIDSDEGWILFEASGRSGPG